MDTCLLHKVQRAPSQVAVTDRGSMNQPSITFLSSLRQHHHRLQLLEFAPLVRLHPPRRHRRHVGLSPSFQLAFVLSPCLSQPRPGSECSHAQRQFMELDSNVVRLARSAVTMLVALVQGSMWLSSKSLLLLHAFRVDHCDALSSPLFSHFCSCRRSSF